MIRGFRYRLYPTPAQAETLSQWVGATRFVYNLCLEQRRDFWRQHRRTRGGPITWITQSRELTDLRRDAPWLASVPRECLQQALRDLEGAFRAFFAGAGFPSPRKKFVNDALRLQMRDIPPATRLNRKWGSIRLPKLGAVKFRWTRDFKAARSLTLSLRAGQWHIAFLCEVEQSTAPPAPGVVGIDRGVANTIMLSTGESFQLPTICGAGSAQRALARCKRGSKRYAAQRRRVARLKARGARQRNHFLHVASTNIADRFGLVAIENLKISNMTARGRGKRGLNRSILAQGWGRFAGFLAYKLDGRGGRLVSVPAAYTSQTCSGCGVIDARSRKSQAVFECVAGGHVAHADHNAALEILRRSTAIVEGSGYGPVEASTREAA